MDMLNDFLEKTLEDIIYSNRDTISNRGLSKFKGNAYRQVILPSGRKIDILGFEIKDGVLNCDIYELKREVINADAICQAFNYYTELKYITKNYFKNIDAKIIMVGRKYEPVSVIDALPIPIEVYTFEYYIDGIKFSQIKNRYTYSEPNSSFSFGLWAFGHAGLEFNEEKSSVTFHSVYDKYSLQEPLFGNKIMGYIEYYVNTENNIELKEEINADIKVEIKPKFIITEIFPEQPQWTLEFKESIPEPQSIMEDMDLEDEECDYSDYEPDILEENEVDLISEKDYAKSVHLNSVTIKNIITDNEYREMQSNLDFENRTIFF